MCRKLQGSVTSQCDRCSSCVYQVISLVIDSSVLTAWTVQLYCNFIVQIQILISINQDINESLQLIRVNQRIKMASVAGLAMGVVGLSISLAKELDYQRTIAIAIRNNTQKVLTFDCSYFDCGKVVQAPPALIHPGESITAQVSKKFGSFGVKGMFLYRYGTEAWQRVCFFFECPVNGRNYAGVHYFEHHTSQSAEWFCENVPRAGQNERMVQYFNDHTFESYITEGNHVGAGYIVSHHC